MIIERFVKTEVGAKFKDVLKGFNKSCEVEYWKDMNDYAIMLAENHWSDDEIAEQLEYIGETCYRANPKDFDFVVVI